MATTPASFKDDFPREQALAPSGYWIVIRPHLGTSEWAVKVYNFATWKHRDTRFADEAAARKYFIQWLL